MQLSECIEKIEKYQNSSDTSPRFVNVKNPADLSAIIQHFNVGNNTLLSIADFAREDENPKIEGLQNELASKSGNYFVTGLTSQLKLQGEYALSKELQNFASCSFDGHVIILCYQCESYLRFRDSRSARLVYSVEGDSSDVPVLVFTFPENPIPPGADSIDGVQSIAAAIEKMNGGIVYVKTKKHKANYPNSLYFIKEESKAFDALCNIDSATHGLCVDFGSDEQWAYALQEVSRVGSWGELINTQFNAGSDLSLIVSNWRNFDSQKQWLYYIALKLNGAGNNWCLNEAVHHADKVTKLVKCVYRSILPLDQSAPDFWQKHDERKKLINAFGGSDQEALDYVQIVRSKDIHALYYLTDSSRIEKELIFELLDKYALQYSRDDVLGILSHIYPDLYSYLQPYRFKNERMYQYFQDYKYQKVINKIFPEFLATVEEQAKKREFNSWLSPRSESIEGLNKTGARLYFVDALGVEYLGFILDRCKSQNMLAKVTLCRCELPSITKLNKDFLASFRNIAPDIKKLDDIKHHGEESFDYRQTKLPVHLIRELEIVDNVLSAIRNKLATESIERAYIISDHGASRLAVIHESENQWEMASKGEHSGRCCPIDEADVQSEYATESNGFWVLANYDRFKGGRKASVEVHGGAALEEVAVPIIELTYITEEIEIGIKTTLPIKISYRKEAALQLFSKTKLPDVTVCVNGKQVVNQFYDAEPQENNLYLVQMPDVKNAGDYQMLVFSNNNPVAELEFTVKKEGASERSIL